MQAGVGCAFAWTECLGLNGQNRALLCVKQSFVRTLTRLAGKWELPEAESVVLDAEHARGAQVAISHNKADYFKMAADLKIIEATVALRIIPATPIEFRRAIKSHLAATLNRRIELNVGCMFQHLRYYAFPLSDIGFDGIRDRSALVIDVATDGYLISDLKLGMIYTADFCLRIHSEKSGE